MAVVDVLLATYNGARYLPAQLASLDAQTHTDWRLILRDDGSSDGSREIVLDWAAQTGRECLVVEDNDARVGPAESFSRLLARSDAPFFAFCDQDDVWEKEKLARLVEAAIQAGEGIVLVHCDLAVVDENLHTVAPSFWRLQENDPGLIEAAPGYRKFLVSRNTVTGCAMLGNASLRAEMLPLPDGAVMHDWWAALTAAYRGQIMALDVPLVRYRQHGSNSVGARSPRFHAMILRFVSDPAASIVLMRTKFRQRSRQASATLHRLGDAMAPDERAFAEDYAQIGSGLRRVGGWHLLAWALASQSRLPLVLHLVMETFTHSDG